MGFRNLAQIIARKDAHAVHTCCRLRANAPKLLYRQIGYEVECLVGMNHGHAIWLAVVGSHLGKKLAIRNACRGCEMQFVGYALSYFSRYVYRHLYTFLIISNVEESLVNRQWLYLVGIVFEYLVHLLRHSLILFPIASHHYQLRAESVRSLYRHSGMNSPTACFIARRRHHTTRTVVAHRNRFSAQFRIVSLLYRSKESIHIYMYNLSHKILSNICQF